MSHFIPNTGVKEKRGRGKESRKDVKESKTKSSGKKKIRNIS
jgi:hypothetical protein